ncbi:MAG: hypothetical protein D3908_11285 [Candidatus Electrothrix sp. AUS4]|nr:hypothetical protein [Candidatus Electrothrix sp. AUS4]
MENWLISFHEAGRSAQIQEGETRLTREHGLRKLLPCKKAAFEVEERPVMANPFPGSCLWDVCGAALEKERYPILDKIRS